MAVLAGSADENELRHRSACPDLEIVYDERQDANKPLDTEFLAWFDRWVEAARRDGKKIAFRCSCGCHRTGRLAAYYQMKYQHLALEDALVVMYARGKSWERHKNIEPQVRALKDHLDGKPCSQEPEYCVRQGGKRNGS
jgi:protein-tyrosine phosphatase